MKTNYPGTVGFSSAHARLLACAIQSAGRFCARAFNDIHFFFLSCLLAGYGCGFFGKFLVRW